jgi:hypothetical protein
VTYSREALDLARFEGCVMDNPRRPGEGAIAYCARIAELVSGKPTEPKDMPSVRLPYKDAE